MPQMPPTITAHDFRALHPKRAVDIACDGAGKGVEEGRPAATGLEFVRGSVKGRGAGGARVDPAGRHVFVVRAGVGRLGAFFAEDAELFWEKRKLAGGGKRMVI